MAPRDGNRFKIERTEIEATASAWQHSGGTVKGLDFSGMAAASGNASRAIDAAKEAAEPAKKATDSIGTRLMVLSDHLRQFTATTEDNDRAAARLFEQVKPR
ncbi:hypothetical protein [Gordonia aurantiaca]|uniref:hypothetical protein n=1 Tax=Gordonia sp. B21 TaxID=3151852 RepID=UPI0032666081